MNTTPVQAPPPPAPAREFTSILSKPATSCEDDAGSDAGSTPATTSVAPSHAEEAQPQPEHEFWLYALPWGLRQLAWAIFGSMLRETDDSQVRHRKLVLAAGVCISVVAIFGGIYNIIDCRDRSDRSSSAVLILAQTAPFAHAAVWTVTYLYARLSGTAPVALGDVWLTGTAACLIADGLSFGDWPLAESFMLMMIVACLFRTPFLAAHLVLYSAAIVAAHWNASSYPQGAPDRPLAAFDYPLMRGGYTRFAFGVASLCATLIVTAGLCAQMWENDHQSRAERASADLGAKLADFLSRYDTQAAEAAIDQAEKKMAADPNLLKSFRLLVDNLEKYRMHLPHWLLSETETAADPGTVPGGELIDGSEGVSMEDELLSISSGRESPRDGQIPPAARVSSSNSRRPTFNRVPSVIITSGSVQALALERHGTNSGGNTHSGTHSGGHTPSGVGNSPHRNAAPVTAVVQRLHPGSSQQFNIVMVKIAFEVAVKNDTFSPKRVPEVINAFVDLVYRHAATTGAAVHSFVGDEILLTWNVAVRVVQAEAKAVRMLARIGKEVAVDGNMRIAGAAFAGPAAGQLAGLPGKQQSLTVSAEWLPALEHLMSVAKRFGCLVIDQTLRSSTTFVVHTRGVAALEVPDWCQYDRLIGTENMTKHQIVPLRRLGVFEVVDERIDNEEGEWMYVLARAIDQHGGAVDRLAAAAMKCVTEGLDTWTRSDLGVTGAQLVDAEAYLESPVQHSPRDNAIVTELAKMLRRERTTTRVVRADTFVNPPFNALSSRVS